MLQFYYRKRPNYSFVLKTNGNSLEVSYSTKYLGLTITDNCNWGQWIENKYYQKTIISLLLCEKTLIFNWSRSFANNLFRVFPECNIIINGVILWGNSPKAKRISLLHKRIVSSIRKETFGTMCSSIEIFEHLDALPST